MPCETKDLGNGGGFAIICSRGRSGKRCAHCGAAAALLCDFPVERVGKRATCDAPLCARCTTKIAGDGDLCRPHARLWDKELGRPTVGPGART